MTAARKLCTEGVDSSRWVTPCFPSDTWGDPSGIPGVIIICTRRAPVICLVAVRGPSDLGFCVEILYTDMCVASVCNAARRREAPQKRRRQHRLGGSAQRLPSCFARRSLRTPSASTRGRVHRDVAAGVGPELAVNPHVLESVFPHFSGELRSRSAWVGLKTAIEITFVSTKMLLEVWSLPRRLWLILWDTAALVARGKL